MKEEFDILFAEHQKLLGELHAMRNVKRSWVGLTDEEVEDFVSALWPVGAGAEKLFRAIEAKLKEKNA
jgi:hypothetical protein